MYSEIKSIMELLYSCYKILENIQKIIDYILIYFVKMMLRNNWLYLGLIFIYVALFFLYRAKVP